MFNQIDHSMIFSKLKQMSEEEIIRSEKDLDNAIDSQIRKIRARFALYSLIIMLDKISQGLDSFSIVEDLKHFLLESIKIDPEISELAKDAMRKYEQV